MKVSVVVVCYNEENNIEKCLNSLLAMDYAREDIEIIIVDNCSEDATQQIVRQIAEKAPQVRLVSNPVRSIAKSRNIGLKEARYPLVAFTDADCTVPRNWLTVLTKGFQQYRQIFPELAAVGGTNMGPKGVSSFYDAVNITLKSLLGNRGSTQGREFGADRLVDHIPTLNILYRKKIIRRLEGFDENFRFVCEDPELNHRLNKAGYKIMHLKDSYVIHRFRPGWFPWIKRLFGYGKGRTRLIIKHPDHFSALFLVPPAIVLLWVSTPVLVMLEMGLKWILAIYLLLMTLYSLCHIGRLRNWKILPTILVLYLITHISYGLGQFMGLRYLSNKRQL
jgi:cellulose synthase/poly-beta-1,6-N-acetylglucosamine synthase-like glycosyltransferase